MIYKIVFSLHYDAPVCRISISVIF